MSQRKLWRTVHGLRRASRSGQQRRPDLSQQARRADDAELRDDVDGHRQRSAGATWRAAGLEALQPEPCRHRSGVGRAEALGVHRAGARCAAGVARQSRIGRCPYPLQLAHVQLDAVSGRRLSVQIRVGHQRAMRGRKGFGARVRPQVDLRQRGNARQGAAGLCDRHPGRVRLPPATRRMGRRADASARDPGDVDHVRHGTGRSLLP